LLNALVRMMIIFRLYYQGLFNELIFLNKIHCSSFLLYRTERRTTEEMEQDLSREKFFDLTMELKGISLLLPENGVLYQ
jgi:hypothetical protein